MRTNPIAAFVRERRREAKLTQAELASKSGVGLRFVRDVEQRMSRIDPKAANGVFEKFRRGQEKLRGMAGASTPSFRLQKSLESVIETRCKRLFAESAA